MGLKSAEGTEKQFITADPQMLASLQHWKTLAKSPYPIAISGEMGSGRTHLARMTHALSRAHHGPLFEIHCAEQEDESFCKNMFGFKEEGLYTSILNEHKNEPNGLLKQAQNGTIVIHHAQKLRHSTQTKLKQFLETGQYSPLHHPQQENSNARLIFTLREESHLAKESDGLDELFSLLKPNLITVMPLRQRKDDIPLLLDYFLGIHAEILGRTKPSPSQKLLPLLKTYAFPENVKELSAMVQNALSRSQHHILASSAFEEWMGKVMDQRDTHQQALYFRPDQPLPTIKTMTNHLVKAAMERSQGNIAVAAKMLGISRQALSQRLKKLESAL